MQAAIQGAAAAATVAPGPSGGAAGGAPPGGGGGGGGGGGLPALAEGAEVPMLYVRFRAAAEPSLKGEGGGVKGSIAALCSFLPTACVANRGAAARALVATPGRSLGCIVPCPLITPGRLHRGPRLASRGRAPRHESLHPLPTTQALP
jgi:hypothetical protein